MSRPTVRGLPPDLSTGKTLTPWECEQKIAAERQRTEKVAVTLRDLVYAVGDYADHTSALGPRRSIVAARAALVEWEQGQ